MDVMIWFFILVSNTMSVIIKFKEDLMAISSSEWIWALRLLLLYLGERSKEKQLEKMSIRWWLGENSLLKESKKREPH